MKKNSNNKTTDKNMIKFLMLMFIIIIVLAIIIQLTGFFGLNTSKKYINEQEISSTELTLNKLGLYIDDEIEKYNEYGDLISVTDSGNIYKFSYEYKDNKIIKFTGNSPFNNSQIIINITYNSLGNVDTLISESVGLRKDSFNYIYNDNELQRIECISMGDFGMSGNLLKTNYYYTKQNINGTDYIIEEIVDMSMYKITSIKVCKEIECNMSSKLIGNYLIPMPYYNDINNLFVIPQNSNRVYNTLLNYTEYSPILLKDLVYIQKEGHEMYLDINGQVVLSNDDSSKRIYNYEQIDENHYYLYELEKFNNDEKEFLNADTNYSYKKYKVYCEANGNIKKLAVIKKEYIDSSKYNLMKDNYEKNALNSAATYGIKLKSYKE